MFDLRGAGDLVTFGGALTICQFLWIVQSQSDIVIAGRSFDPHQLGLYSEALFLTLIITGRFLPPVNEVCFPTYAELYKDGRPLGPFFLKVQRMVALVVMPAYLGLSLVAAPAVATLFGPKVGGDGADRRRPRAGDAGVRAADRVQPGDQRHGPAHDLPDDQRRGRAALPAAVPGRGTAMARWAWSPPGGSARRRCWRSPTR